MFPSLHAVVPQLHGEMEKIYISSGMQSTFQAPNKEAEFCKASTSTNTEALKTTSKLASQQA